MKITILGNGYIAGYLESYLQKKHGVTIIARSCMNYGDKNVLNEYLRYERSDIVFGAFGFTGKPNIDEAEKKKDLCWSLNVQDPLKVCSVCADMKIPFVHISSGCIFNGYAKEWEDTDNPNFGLFDHSSFYSKTKHAFEMLSSDLPGSIIRIRMPFSGCRSERNYLVKISKYKKLIDCMNSRTCVEDLCEAMVLMTDDGTFMTRDIRQIFHIVNPNPLLTSSICAIASQIVNCFRDTEFVEESRLNLAAPRSNCILSLSNHPHIANMPDEVYSIKKCVRGALS